MCLFKKHDKMFRRKLGVITAVMLLTPVFVILMMSNPDLSGEQFLIENIADLRQRLQHAEMLNRDRISDVLFLSNQFKTLIGNGNSSYQVSLSDEAKKLLENLTLNTDLNLPSIYSYMPHLLKSFDATTPAFKMSKGRTSVDIVLGIPTVKREVQSYLMTTLKNLVDSMSESEKLKCLIVVLVAESDIDYVTMVGSQVGRKFSEHVESGLIEIISPPASFFPDFSKLKQTLGDTMERVRWRTKQNLDYAFLMMYSQPKGIYYVQLEDDIQTKKGFIHTMTNFALRKSTENKNWIVLDFCQLGFIGKMFKCAELPYLIQFFVMFYNDKPVDWLLDYMIQTKVCNLDKDVKNCKKAKESVWIHYKPSIFQHIGTHSSLKGKVQKLKDKQYGKVQLHFPHSNPPARAESDIKHYKQHSFERAYGGETYFWGLLPQAGDKLRIHFTPPVPLKRYLFRSGNVEHPSDRFYNTTIEILPVSPSYNKSKLNMTRDYFIIMGSFDDMGLADGYVDPSLGPIKTLRMTIHVESENWAILSEILVQADGR